MSSSTRPNIATPQTPDAFEAWAAEHFSSIVHTALRPDGRGIVVTRTVLTSHPPYFCGYVIGGAMPDDLSAAPCHGGVTLAGRAADGMTWAGFDFNHMHDAGNAELTQERARREAHALADWLNAETEETAR